MQISMLGYSFLYTLPLMLLAWMLSCHQRNVGLVDIFWSLFFLSACFIHFALSPMITARAWLVLILVSIWALRLATYLAWRNLGKAEDRRYVAIRERNQPGFAWKSLYLVFLFQLVLATLISPPLHAAMQSSSPLYWLDALALLIWLIGFLWESAADCQLASFKNNKNNQGKLLRTGVWRYCRHPNYFGESLVWLAYGLLAVAGGSYWPLISVAVMIILLMRYTGVGLMEKDITHRHPDYQAYIQSTNAFFPWFPKS